VAVQVDVIRHTQNANGDAGEAQVGSAAAFPFSPFAKRR
jgi:hypothetical protein